MIYPFIYSKCDDIQCDNMLDFIKVLSEEKSKIDKYQSEWDKIKKYINDHEYIYVSQNKNKNISNIIPISRSFFKLIEMIKDLDLIDASINLTGLCMAEGPGGFIQSLLRLPNIQSIAAITLISDNRDVPNWNHGLITNEIVEIYSGVNGDGDLCNMENILSVINKYKRNSTDFITGDGGFDYSEDYNKQEFNSLPLIYSEIFLALNVQKENGAFICKFFDIFQKTTIQLLYILSISYDKIYIHKPSISRVSNSEKYIVCVGYKGYNKEIINNLVHHFNNPRDLDIKVDSNFQKELIKFNKYYTENQIYQINKGLELIIKNKRVSHPSVLQINKAIEWCNKYEIPINRDCYYMNKHYSL